MRKGFIITFMLLALGGVAAAQVPTSGNIFFGYSYLNTDLSSAGRANTNGWEGTLEGRVFPHIGIVADFNGNYGSQDFPVSCPVGVPVCTPSLKMNFSEENVMFGLGFRLRLAGFVRLLKPCSASAM